MGNPHHICSDRFCGRFVKAEEQEASSILGSCLTVVFVYLSLLYLLGFTLITTRANIAELKWKRYLAREKKKHSKKAIGGVRESFLCQGEEKP